MKRNIIAPKETGHKEIKKCPWCNSGFYKAWGSTLRGFASAKCTECGLVFVRNRLNNSGLEKYYKNYLSQVHQAEAKLNFQRKIMYKIEFLLIHHFIKKGRVLDVGCSGGYFLDIFKKKGFKTCGVEFGEDAWKKASKKHKVYYGFFPKIDIKERFNLIVFRGVIEHTTVPRAYLDKAVSLLTPRGLVFITSTPNSDSFCCGLFKESWNQHEPEGHLMHFNQTHFDGYFNKKGFIKLAERFLYEETPYANLHDDILKVAKAIKLRQRNGKITFRSPAFWGNMMSLIYQKGAK